MSSRLELQTLLEGLIDDFKVYYQSPPNTGMEYPCIKYEMSGIEALNADDINYVMSKKYQITVLSTTPDHVIIDKILKLPMTSYDRRYIADSIYHDVIKINF